MIRTASDLDLPPEAALEKSTETQGASCECGTSDIPHEFFDAARGMAA